MHCTYNSISFNLRKFIFKHIFVQWIFSHPDVQVKPQWKFKPNLVVL